MAAESLMPWLPEGPIGTVAALEDFYKTNVSEPYGDPAMSVSGWWLFILVPMIVFATIGNFLVCVVVVRVPKLQTVNNIFLMSLAVADLMVAILVMPLGLVKDIYGYWPVSPHLCAIWNTLDVLCCTASILHISVISLDRYLAICNPIRFNQRRNSRSSTFYKIATVWLTSTALSSPLLIMGLSDQEGFVDYRYCVIVSPHFKMYGSAVAFFLPLTIVVITYVLTVLTLHRLTQHSLRILQSGTFKRDLDYGREITIVSEHPSNGPSRIRVSDNKIKAGNELEEHEWLNSSKYRNESKSSLRSNNVTIMSRNERKANKVLFLVFVVFVLMWTPFFFVNILFTLCATCKGAQISATVLTWLGWAASMVNPIIYTIFNSNFRRALGYTLMCRNPSLMITSAVFKSTQPHRGPTS